MEKVYDWHLPWWTASGSAFWQGWRQIQQTQKHTVRRRWSDDTSQRGSWIPAKRVCQTQWCAINKWADVYWSYLPLTWHCAVSVDDLFYLCNFFLTKIAHAPLNALRFFFTNGGQEVKSTNIVETLSAKGVRNYLRVVRYNHWFLSSGFRLLWRGRVRNITLKHQVPHHPTCQGCCDVHSVL